MAVRKAKKETGTAPEEETEPVPEPDTELVAAQERIETMKATLSDKNREIRDLTKERDRLAEAQGAPAAPSADDPTIEITIYGGVKLTMKSSKLAEWFNTYLQPGQGRHERNIIDVQQIG